MWDVGPVPRAYATRLMSFAAARLARAIGKLPHSLRGLMRIFMSHIMHSHGHAPERAVESRGGWLDARVAGGFPSDTCLATFPECPEPG